MDEPFGFGDGVELSGAHQRAEPRDSLFLQAHLLRGSREPLVLRVRNLSSGGMMADCPEPLQRGEAVEIELRGIGAVSGKVAWVRDGRIGVAFDVRVDPKLARKPVGTGAKSASLVPPRSVVTRRPGLRID